MKKYSIKGYPARASSSLGRTAGISLVELMIAMAVGLVVLGAVYSVFTIQNKTFGNQEQMVEMQQNVRAAMDMMTREIRMAGYDPLGVNSDNDTTNNFSGVTVNTSQLQIRSDTRGVGPDDPPDGIIQTNSQENIIYVFDTGNKRITRNTGGGDQPLAENIDSFSFAYLDSSGNLTAVSAEVRQIRITITGRTAKPDPAYAANSGYRQYTLTSVIALRN